MLKTKLFAAAMLAAALGLSTTANASLTSAIGEEGVMG